MNFNHLPNKTKLSFFKLLLGNKIKYIIGQIYILVSKYRVKGDLKNMSDIVFVISYEKISRSDHSLQFRYVCEQINKKTGHKVSFFEVKRVLNFNIFEIFKNFFKFKNFFDIINNQMNSAFLMMENKFIKKLVVFADTTPFENYICEYYNSINIETYSLQHGFYIPDDNRIFELVYKSSNAKNFFVWDERTLKYMRKHQGKKKRNFIKCGPISKKLYSPSLKEKKANDSIKRIAIYGCGKDQIQQNEYLVGLYKYLKKHSEYEVAFISHPVFKFFFRLYMSMKNKILFCPNKKKNEQYDIHLVLNSGVWLELEEREEKYFLLNQDYDNNQSYNQTIVSILTTSNYNSQSELKPFYKDSEALDIMINNLINKREK